MIDSNILETPIEQVVLAENEGIKTVVDGKTVTYNAAKPMQIDEISGLELAGPISQNSFKFSNTATGLLPAPLSSVAAFSKDSRYTRELVVESSTSNARPIDYYDKKGVNHSIIWNAQKQLVLAEAINAKSSSIAFTSFEDAEKGNWAYAGTPTLATTPAAPTGRYYLALNGSSSTLSRSVTAGVIYILSYWRYNGGSLSLTGANILATNTGQTINNWTFYSQRISASGTTLTITGSGNIDEVRLYPEGAQMKTFTHIPLKGMTSMSDIRGRVTYYEYDGLGRLSVVRDQNRNIVQKICYNYAGQPEDCGGFRNQAQTGSFTRNNCATGGTGSAVSYTVAAGRFTSLVSQADANTMATNALASEGQANANANGTCTFYNDVQSGSFTRNNCSSGYIGSTVTYTIAAGAYSSTVSKADANSQATTAVSSGGQAYANTNGTCTAVTIYARAEYAGVYNDGDNTYGTVLLKFYSNAACTTPYSVSNLTVNYKRVRTNCGGGGTVTGNFNAVCNGTSTSIGLQTLLEDDGIHCWNYAFSVTAGTGYTAK